MFPHLSNTGKVVVFFGLVFTLSVVTISLIPGDAVVPANMATPLAATFLMLFLITREGYTTADRASLGLRRAGFLGWGPALLLPLPILLFNYGFIWSTGLGTVVTPEPGLVALLIRLPVGLVIGSLLALGEEIGFRGYVLPRLVGLGRQKAVLVSGLLHALWHLPLIFLTPYYHSEGNLLLVTPLFVLTLTAAGVIYGYLRLTYASLWPAVILHGAFNAYWGVLAAMTAAASPLAAEYLGGESGLLTLIPTALLAGWLLRRLSPDPELAPVVTAQ